MKISKTVFNMAVARGLELEIYSHNDKEQLLIWEYDEDDNIGEAWLIYTIKEDGLFFEGFCYNKIDDVPYWISSEAQLKELIKGLVA